MSGTEISFSGSTLTAEGDDASVIRAEGNSGREASTVTVTNSHLSAAHGNLIDAIGTSLNLTFSGNNQFDAPDGHLLHVAKDENTGQVSTVNVVLDNAPLLTGDMEAEDLNSTLNVTLEKGSAWKGRGHNVNNVTVDGSSAWHLSADSDVTQLAVSQGSYVNFVNRHEQYNTLTVRNDLTGDGGTFRMHVSMEKQQGDQLRVDGHIRGQHTLSIDNNAAENTRGTEVHTVAVAQHADGNFKLEHLVEEGGYLYDLRKKSSGAATRAAGGESWELYGTQKVTSAANAVVDFISSAYLMQYAESQTLLQRMGDLHYGTQDNRLWGRGFVGRFDHFSSGKLDGFSMNYHGFQLGGDRKLEQTHGNLFLGVFASLGNSTQQQRPGDGNLTSRSLGLYASYLDNSQFYLDSWLKAGSMNNEFNVFDTAGRKVHGKGDSNNISASVEAGQRFYFNDTHHQGGYLEPQLQYTLAYQGSSTVNASSGLHIKTDSMTSSLGRASLLVGYQFDTVGLYVKSGYLREFSGTLSYYLNDSQEQQHYKGGWWNNGIGVTATIAGQHTFYVDLDSSTGGEFNQRQANMGYRFSF
ncbi:MAG: autotransporter outer membrane beta-barrel domain-containing protein [Enterobacteriaceae bacterium]